MKMLLMGPITLGTAEIQWSIRRIINLDFFFRRSFSNAPSLSSAITFAFHHHGRRKRCRPVLVVRRRRRNCSRASVLRIHLGRLYRRMVGGHWAISSLFRLLYRCPRYYGMIREIVYQNMSINKLLITWLWWPVRKIRQSLNGSVLFEAASDEWPTFRYRSCLFCNFHHRAIHDDKLNTV